MIKAELIDSMGTDLSVVNAARVSFDKRSEWEICDYSGEVLHGELTLRDTKLINYLAEHGHYSPFGHCFASFRVSAPIFVARQLVKHKFLRWNEVSRRYVDDEPVLYVPEVWRGRAEDKKQGSSGTVDLGKLEDPKYMGTYNNVLLYEWLVHAKGVCPEQARMVLPQSTMTTWWWSGSLDAFANMCNLRLKEDTQYETRLVAQQIDEALVNVWPVSWRALVSA